MKFNFAKLSKNRLFVKIFLQQSCLRYDKIGRFEFITMCLKKSNHQMNFSKKWRQIWVKYENFNCQLNEINNEKNFMEKSIHDFQKRFKIKDINTSKKVFRSVSEKTEQNRFFWWVFKELAVWNYQSFVKNFLQPKIQLLHDKALFGNFDERVEALKCFLLNKRWTEELEISDVD